MRADNSLAMNAKCALCWLFGLLVLPSFLLTAPAWAQLEMPGRETAPWKCLADELSSEPPAAELRSRCDALLTVDGALTYFVSERALNARSLGELLPDPSDRSLLTFRQRFEKNPELYTQGGRYPAFTLCSSLPEPARRGGDYTAEDLAALVDESPLSFIAGIRDVVPGWSTALDRVARVSILEVERVLGADREGRLVDGQQFLLMTIGGPLQLRDVVICDESPVGQFPLETGDRVLVYGALHPGHPGAIAASAFFPIQGSEVIVESYHSDGLIERRLPLAEIETLLEVREPTQAAGRAAEWRR